MTKPSFFCETFYARCTPPTGVASWTGSSASTGTSDRVRTSSVESDREELWGGEKMREVPSCPSVRRDGGRATGESLSRREKPPRKLS